MKHYKYLSIKPYEGIYLLKKVNDQYLEILSEIFDDGIGWTNSVKRALLDTTGIGITGNKVEVEIAGSMVKIFPQFVDNPEDYEIEIDRSILLDLINKWLQLVEKKALEIYFIRYDDGRIEVTERLPEKE